MTTPLQVPGGPELVVILFIFLIPVAIIAGIVYLLQRGSNTGDEQRIEELERQVEELKSDAEPREESERTNDVERGND
ncbi:preprotein translocase subunit TatA [Natrarchaeobius chitinivorans]|uniref:Preprotein translocase subunit TatA n=1 Tax=Natrarchaeobius chitinivorans TaxID=1679083 RepID=A0A3N6LUR5_NATCH|nr:preprotein translocase subunit TatA [Natrarchaeobius chitinivorans]RQG94033.1 preprotein translocase subunit TatA [Natrarchaeobius chitinivorans]